jgi:hypothetical protein
MNGGGPSKARDISAAGIQHWTLWVEHKYRSYPVKLSTFDGYANEQIESLVTVQTSDEDIFSTRVTVDQISAEQCKVREDIKTIVTNHDAFCDAFGNVVADKLYLDSKIRDSISDLAEHGFDNEKLELLIDKVVERLLPTIGRADEKADANFKRIPDILALLALSQRTFCFQQQ